LFSPPQALSAALGWFFFWTKGGDESVWRYSITLKNIITAGNLNRAVSLF
jgi:hypothetical protein